MCQTSPHISPSSSQRSRPAPPELSQEPSCSTCSAEAGDSLSSNGSMSENCESWRPSTDGSWISRFWITVWELLPLRSAPPLRRYEISAIQWLQIHRPLLLSPALRLRLAFWILIGVLGTVLPAISAAHAVAQITAPAPLLERPSVLAERNREKESSCFVGFVYVGNGASDCALRVAVLSD